MAAEGASRVSKVDPISMRRKWGGENSTPAGSLAPESPQEVTAGADRDWERRGQELQGKTVRNLLKMAGGIS